MSLLFDAGPATTNLHRNGGRRRREEALVVPAHGMHSKQWKSSRAVPERIESWGIPEFGFDLFEDCRRAKEAAGMALSDDLRERVVEAVVIGGMSRNAAAKRFGVSIASAMRWVWRFQATGEISPAPTGGDRRSDRIEAHGDYLLGLIRSPAGHHGVGNPGAADRQLRRAFLFVRDLALLRSPRDHF